MIIQHNLAAMFGDRQYKITNDIKKKSSEKLGSGYRINRAADDAAGLAISEKMRRQIRGLTQASLNVQDGISMVQSAEGALNEVHEMLQRMNELCVKAANNTLTYEDRDYIQQEIYSLSDEINRVGAVTSFNEMKVLDGIPQTHAVAVAPQATINGSSGTITPAANGNDAYLTIETIDRGDVVYIPGRDGASDKYFKAATREDINAYEQEWREYYAAKSAYDIAKRAYDNEWAEYNEAKRIYDEDPDAEGAVEPTPPTTASPTPPTEPIRRDGTSSGKAQLIELPELNVQFVSSLAKDNLEANSGFVDTVGITYSLNGGVTRYDLHFYGPLTINLQVGSNSEDTFTFRIPAVNASSLGVYDINVKDSDGSGALDGIGKIQKAMEHNSKYRADLGAIQNRMEHMVKNLDNVVENTTAAESRFRDTDMADEITRNANTELLAQAGQMILAQANQSKQGVLNLLQ